MTLPTDPAWTPFKKAVPIPFTREKLEAMVRDAIASGLVDMTIEKLSRMVEDGRAGVTIWKNSVYQVEKRRTGHMVWLSIKRIDKQAVHDWRDFQRIKNELVGRECEGVELYPAESRVVDTANQYHLWVIEDRAFRFPFGMPGGVRMGVTSPESGTVQRPFEEDHDAHG